MKKLFLLLLACAAYVSGWAQYTPTPIPTDTLYMLPVSPTDLWSRYGDEHGFTPKRTPPMETTLPTCSYVDGQICITSEVEWGAFAYYVLTDERETVLSGNGFLTANAPYFIDLSPLNSGCYTFVLQHGVYYAASFVH